MELKRKSTGQKDYNQ